MISTLKNNITLLKIQRKSLQRSLEMMDDNWGTYTNEAGFKMADNKFMKTLMDKEYICPFSHPFNGGAKPFLAEMYKIMTEEMIKDIDYYIKELECKEDKA